ncbi:hypothetical protein CANCADRAFT_106338 [Tortispora caseinolytica NRRL Y-17796]|uniref:Protein YOP1 n=1 Tax=Tortispora caseinolytica NRRL Y-17796 TaxID=767744 RepID=A0A1E4TFD8_9ASCO|nr:hypothetical protein CANCADRAFT_106338 [Tortispora caseinolytica NRRL Y-17796]
MSVNAYLSEIDKALSKFQYARIAEARTGIPKAYIALGFAGIYILMTFLNIGGVGALLANFAGLVVPGYFSLIALESPSDKDDKQFLTYWVIYAGFTVIEFWSRAILYWIPFYWFFKAILLLWLGLPQTAGAKFVYNSFLQPYAKKLHQYAGAPVDAGKSE